MMRYSREAEHESDRPRRGSRSGRLRRGESAKFFHCCSDSGESGARPFRLSVHPPRSRDPRTAGATASQTPTTIRRGGRGTSICAGWKASTSATIRATASPAARFLSSTLRFQFPSPSAGNSPQKAPSHGRSQRPRAHGTPLAPRRAPRCRAKFVQSAQVQVTSIATPWSRQPARHCRQANTDQGAVACGYAFIEWTARVIASSDTRRRRGSARCARPSRRSRVASAPLRDATP